jgi:hypothetical protein
MDHIVMAVSNNTLAALEEDAATQQDLKQKKHTAVPTSRPQWRKEIFTTEGQPRSFAPI